MIPAETYQLEQELQQDTLKLLGLLSTEQRADILDIIFNVAFSLLDSRIKNTTIKDLDYLRAVCDKSVRPTNHKKLSTYQAVRIFLVLAHKIVPNENDMEGNFVSETYKVIKVTQKYSDVNGQEIVAFLRNLRRRNTSHMIQLLRLLPITQKQASKFMNGLQKRQDEFAHQAIEHELKRLYQNEFKKKGKVYPRLLFEKLNKVNSETITIFFSGFGSENSCKLTQWESITSRVKTEAYAIRWQSKSMQELFSYGANKVSEFGKFFAGLGGFPKLFSSESPFLEAFEMAQIVGQFLADFFIEHFKGFNLVLVGFSLGTELIKNIMVRLQHLGFLDMLKEVVLMGGVADHGQIQRILEKQKKPILVYNFYTDNDSVLKYLLWIYKNQINPIGLNKISKVGPHQIVNQDCSDYVDGHLDYRKKMHIICDYVAFLYS